MKNLFVLYVRDQGRSTRFYSAVLDLRPVLDVPGMTEFSLSPAASLGIMPESGARRLLGSGLPEFARSRAPRAEIYIWVEDPAARHERALRAGATDLGALAERDWGDLVAYCLDPDGYVLAFAKRK